VPFIKRTYRDYRTDYLQMRYPTGTFLSCNGANVYCDFSSENYCWYDGHSEYLDYELNVFCSLFQRRTPDTILDVGSHWGFYPAFFENSKYSDSIGRVIAVEADPFNQNALSKTLAKINRLSVKQINAAISDKDGFAELYSGGGACRHTYSSPNGASVGKIEAITLDSLVETNFEDGEVLTHVKLDIDGYESAFFAGGEHTLKRFKPIIMMEFWAKGLMASGISLESYWEMLQENYHIQEACFPNYRLKPLGFDDLSYLVRKTMSGITNLVLIPKDSFDA